MLIALIVLLFASGAILRLLWYTNKLHSDRLSNAQQQYLTAQLLIDDRSEESAAALWKLHWIATQQRFESYTNKRHWPRLYMLYHETPYHLHRRIEAIGGRANDGVTVEQQPGANGMLVAGLQDVAEELSTRKHPYSSPLKIATFLILPAMLLWIYLYHAFVFKPMRRDSLIAEDELHLKDNQLDTLTYSDHLTDTSNRRAITEYLSAYQNQNNGNNDFVALAVLDLDYFQQINDVFGYFAGDAVLREVAERVRTELRDDDQFGRLDSDRYGIVLCNLLAPKNAEQIIDRIQRAIEQPIIYKENTLNVTCTVGASVQHSDEIDIGELFKLSDEALLQAKRNRRGSVFLLSDKQQAALSRQRKIINRIKNSSPDDIFDLAFQPIVHLDSRQIASCECLLRWIPDEPENLNASELVPILEMYGDINEVGLWILKSSMRQLKAWQTDYSEDLKLSVNLSARQLETDDFSHQIVSIAEALDLSPATVSLELTETVAIKQLEAGRHHLAQLVNNGFNVSLDDFGTGYSSLQYLKQIPATSVKIDQSFVVGMLSDERDMAIVKAAIDIARAIGLTVIAEGIDTEEQAQCLQSLGCQFGQGYMFSKALTGTEFEALLQPRTNTGPIQIVNPPAA